MGRKKDKAEKPVAFVSLIMSGNGKRVDKMGKRKIIYFNKMR